MLFKKEIEVCSPVDGEVLTTSAVKDETFSHNMLGRGFAIRPTSNVFCSPIKGVVSLIAETGHAFSVKSKDGLEILVHIGIDTVQINSKRNNDSEPLKCFKPLIQVGKKVKSGTPIIEADISEIKKLGYDTITPVVCINNEFLGRNKEVSLIKNDVGVSAGENVLVIKTKK